MKITIELSESEKAQSKKYLDSEETTQTFQTDLGPAVLRILLALRLVKKKEEKDAD